MPTPGQILVALVVIAAVLMAAGVLVPFTPLVVGLLLAFGLIFTKFVS